MSTQAFRKQLKSTLLKPVDNSGIVIFRIIFGLLITLESGGAIATGWVKRTFIDPTYNFPFIDLEFLSPLPGNGMYFFYGLMAIFGIGVMVGFYYRISLGAFTIMWAVSYFMQKVHYNNHYYLLILLCLLMLLIPAHHNLSFDANRNQVIRNQSCPQWCYIIFKVQLGIVFTYAALAKVNPDWLHGVPLSMWFEQKKHFPIIGPLLGTEWIIPIVSYGGIFFDAFIIPALSWKKTRLLAFITSIGFHGFNSAVFHIGIFPYLMIGANVLFFPPEKIRSIFLRNKFSDSRISPSENQFFPPGFLPGIFLYFIIQLALPLRHLMYAGNVNWTEEGHRMSWRMMLRSKSGIIHFHIKDNETGETTKTRGAEYFTPTQLSRIASKPDLIWQAVKIIKSSGQYKNKDISITVDAKVSLNGKPYETFVDPEVDLTKVKWKRFSHSDWILDYPY